MTDHEGTPPVLIIGAGPVGMTAALTLSYHGIPALVLEEGPAPSHRSNASTFHPPSVEILTTLGVGDDLVARGRKVKRLQYRDIDYGVLADLDMSILSSDTQYPFRLQVEQNVLTSLAAQYLADPASGVNVIYGERVVEARQGGDWAEVTTSTGSTYRSRWIIAADGAHSAVRKSLGIEFQGSTYQFRYLTVKTTLSVDSVLPGIAPVTYVSGGENGFGILALPDHWRVAFRIPENLSETEAQAPEYLQSRLQAAIGSQIGTYPIRESFVFAAHRRTANTFRVGRVLLAGDAAHVNSPAGGMGMNSGIHDAWAYGAVLSRVIEGQEHESALTRTAEERRWVAEAVIGKRSDQNYRDIVEQDPDTRRDRVEKLTSLATDQDATREHLLRTSMLDHAPRSRDGDPAGVQRLRGRDE